MMLLTFRETIVTNIDVAYFQGKNAKCILNLSFYGA